MVSSDVLRLYRRFRGRTGGIVGQDASRSLALARSLTAARAAGCTFGWEDDPERMPRDRRCTCGCGAVIDRCESCVLYSEDGEVLASLCGIWDADDEYRRIVEAELAVESGF